MNRVLITGSNRGIGLALVKESLVRGNQVFASCRLPEQAFELKKLEQAHSGQLSILHLDLADEKSYVTARDEVARQAGALDVLINNAGIFLRDASEISGTECPLDRLQSEDLLQTLRINTVAPLLVTRALFPLLRKGEDARVAFISSGMGSIANKAAGGIEYGYSASKAALNMYARVLGNDLQKDGVSVVTLSPGWVATDMGTANAPLKPAQVATGLLNVIQSLRADQSGSFLNWQGEEMPW